MSMTHGRYMSPIPRDTDYGNIRRMSEDAIKAQPPKVWHAVERRIWAQWPFRTRDATKTNAGDPLEPGWLTWERALYLEALDVPVRYLFTGASQEAGGLPGRPL